MTDALGDERSRSVPRARDTKCRRTSWIGEFPSVDGIDEHIGIEDQHSRFVQHLIERLAVGNIDSETSASPDRKRGQVLRCSSA